MKPHEFDFVSDAYSDEGYQLLDRIPHSTT
jgi:hypothetical protein